MGEILPMTSGAVAGGNDQFLTVKQAAREVGVSEDTVRRAYAAGHLRVVRFGARLQGVRVRHEELVRWMAAGGRTR